jgi:hypothetical protein
MCRRGGAWKEVLEKVTHNARGDIVDAYTHWDWAPLCEAVLCLQMRDRIVDASVDAPLQLHEITVEAPGIEPAWSVDRKPFARRVLDRDRRENKLLRELRALPPLASHYRLLVHVYGNLTATRKGGSRSGWPGRRRRVCGRRFLRIELCACAAAHDERGKPSEEHSASWPLMDEHIARSQAGRIYSLKGSLRHAVGHPDRRRPTSSPSSSRPSMASTPRARQRLAGRRPRWPRTRGPICLAPL